MTFLKIKNWENFQHYKYRNPSWIKLHKKLLDDYEFQGLPLASRALAPMLWLVASETNDGRIPADFKKLAFRLRISEQELIGAIKPLIDNGDIIDASGLLADVEPVAIPEKREEDIEKTETDRSTVASDTSQTNADFKKFKEACPKRYGANPWTPAEKLFRDIVRKREATAIELTEAAARCTKTYLHLLGQDRETVPQAQTWLRQRRWKDYPPPTEEEAAKEAEQASRKIKIVPGTAPWYAWDKKLKDERGRGLPNANSWLVESEYPPTHRMEAAE